jgi:hypothetical protein
VNEWSVVDGNYYWYPNGKLGQEMYSLHMISSLITVTICGINRVLIAYLVK